MNIEHIRTHQGSLGWAFVLLGRNVMAKTSIFNVNLGWNRSLVVRTRSK